MKEYYSDEKKNTINLDSESCSFDLWLKNENPEYLCCQHKNGFFVFLKPDELKLNDEYKDNDPYSVEENLINNFHQRRLNSTIELIREHANEINQVLLDLGCGQGHFTDKIKKEFQHFEVFGLDYSLTAIEYANSYFNDIDFVVADAYHPPFVNEYFDIIVCNNIWEHIPDPLNLLTSISRILKDNGLLIISTPSRYRFANLIRVCFGKKVCLISNLHVTEYSVGQVKEQLEYGGYSLDKVVSPAIKERRLILRLLKPLFRLFLKILGSHHVLEGTVFYSATKHPTVKS